MCDTYTDPQSLPSRGVIFLERNNNKKQNKNIIHLKKKTPSKNYKKTKTKALTSSTIKKIQKQNKI